MNNNKLNQILVILQDNSNKWYAIDIWLNIINQHISPKNRIRNNSILAYQFSVIIRKGYPLKKNSRQLGFKNKFGKTFYKYTN